MDGQASQSKKNTFKPLIIGIIVVGIIIVALFIAVPLLLSTGTFNSGGPGAGSKPVTVNTTSNNSTATTTETGVTGLCIGNPGYICEKVVLVNGMMLLTAGQNTGVVFDNATFYAVNYSVKGNAPSTFNISMGSSYPHSQEVSTIYSGQTVNLTIQGGSQGNQLPNNQYTGTLWIVYTYNGNQTVAKVGAITVG